MLLTKRVMEAFLDIGLKFARQTSFLNGAQLLEGIFTSKTFYRQ